MQAVETKVERGPRNGVDTPTLFATLNAVKGQPELAKFQFRATNRWVAGTHSRSRIESFTGAGGEHAHKGVHEYDADHPAVLVGGDQAPTPVEFLLHALAACITAGIANIAAARGVTLTEVESTDRGRHRPARHPRPLGRGAQRLPAHPRQLRASRATRRAEKLREIVEQSRARSAVYDVLTQRRPGRDRGERRLRPRRRLPAAPP